ncbi:hypothetical protein CRENBAI_006901 [Crenichthys baileyi]|uniref:Uncharacterized protein n=1 Tax=Crenichthys baileyi TaxID=28760 RepID=A0AAV9SLJ0_9TELE
MRRVRKEPRNQRLDLQSPKAPSSLTSPLVKNGQEELDDIFAILAAIVLLLRGRSPDRDRALGTAGLAEDKENKLGHFGGDSSGGHRRKWPAPPFPNTYASEISGVHTSFFLQDPSSAELNNTEKPVWSHIKAHFEEDSADMEPSDDVPTLPAS